MAKSLGEAWATERPVVLTSPCKDPDHRKPQIFYKPGQEKEMLDLMIQMGMFDVVLYPIPVAKPGKTTKRR